MVLLFALFLNSVFAEDIVTMLQKSVTLNILRSDKIVVEKKEFFKVTDLGTALKITGLKIGTGEVHAGDRHYRVHVMSSQNYQTYQKLREWLKGKRGLSLMVQQQKISIQGEFLTFEDWRELDLFMNENDEYFTRARISAAIQKKISDYLQKLTEANHLPFSAFSLSPYWTLSFSKNDQPRITRYKNLIQRLGIQIETATQALSSLPMIEVTILAVEINRQSMHQMGIRWNESTPITVAPSLGLDSEALTVTLDHLESSGDGKILASPTLLTQSGEEATFHSGGELPIKSMNRFSSNVTWKQYGIIMHIKPLADYDGKMDIQIDCEVSMPDASTQIDGVQGMLVNKISSHFNLRETKTIALSGLLKEEWGRSKVGLPGLSRIPLLSLLFSSEHYRNNQSELVFFVTPRIRK